MAIDTIESSENDAVPVALFLFQVGVVKYAYNTSTEEIIKDGVTYKPDEVLVTGSIESTVSEKNVPLTIETDVSFEIAQLFLDDLPNAPMRLTVFLGHLNELEYRVIWKGKVTNVDRVEDHKANITCEQDIAIVSRGGLTYRFGPGCQHSVYQGGCNLDFNANATDGTVQTVDGKVITATEWQALPAGDLVGGVAQFNGNIYRMIMKHVGAEITLARAIPGLVTGNILKAASGCDKSVSRCQALGNFANHLAFNTVPLRNPFNGLSSRSNTSGSRAGSLGNLSQFQLK